MQFLRGKIIDLRVYTVRPIATILALVLLPGCGGQRPPTIPSAVTEDLFVLGTDHSFTAGMRVSELYRTLVNELDGVIELEEQSISELGDQLIQELGINPETHDMTVYGALNQEEEAVIPTLLVRAPIPDNILEELEARSEIVSPGANSSSNQTNTPQQSPMYSTDDAPGSLFFTRASDGLLAVSGSTSQLQSMTARVSETTGTLKKGMLPLVAGAELWFVARDLDAISEELASVELPEDVAQIVSSLASIAGRVEMPSETIRTTVFLAPRDGIDHRDISDLIRGGIAFLKIQLEGDLEQNAAVLEFLERINVSEHSNFSRVQISITHSDFNTFAKSMRIIISNMDLSF